METDPARIHPTAIVHPRARLGEGVEIGPYAIVDEHVAIGRGTKLDAHCVVRGRCDIGEDNRIGVGAVIGLEPQDVSYKGEASAVRIGSRNVIREYAQVHRGTKAGSTTEIGDDNFIMGFAHVAHNCKVGSRVILANGTLLAGHVQVEDYAFISGLCLVHQFTRIGSHAMMRGGSRVSLDVPPYCIADDANTVRSINTVGLERRGFSAAQIRAIKDAFKRVFYGEGAMAQKIDEMMAQNPAEDIRRFLEFIRGSKNGVCRPPTKS